MQPAGRAIQSTSQLGGTAQYHLDHDGSSRRLVFGLLWQSGCRDAKHRSAGSLLVSNIDFLPTMLEHLGLMRPTDDQPALSGRSFASLLQGNEREESDRAIFYESENVRAIRTDRWKYIERFRQSPNELYDLRADPRELENLIDREQLEDTRNVLALRMHDYFDRVAVPQWDLWNGGTSTTGLIMRDLFENPVPWKPSAR